MDGDTLPSRAVDAGTVLAGRRVELRLLGRRLEQARSGRPQVVIVEGDAGMGKSALLESWVGRQRDGAVIRWSRCDEFERHLVFGLAELLVDDRELSICSEVEVGRRLLSMLGDLQVGDDGVGILVIDDVQWIDRSSAQALRFALRRLRADRILCLVARRPGADDLGSTLTEDPTATTVLRLGPLDASAVIELARRLRSWQLPTDAAQRLVLRTGGVPLLVQAVVQGATDLAQLDSRVDVPSSAVAIATRMLGAVDPEAQRLAETAAVLAEPTDLVVLGRVANLTDPSAALTSATNAGLVTMDRLGLVDCAHALLREAIYSGLPLAQRRDLHALAAKWTTGERQLAHRAAAADRPDPLLVTDLLDAAAAAHSSLQYAVAAIHRLRARSVSDDPAQREQLLLEALIDKVEAQDLIGAEELAAAARDSPSSAMRALALGLLARESGQIGTARTMLQDALDLASATDDRVGCARAAVAAALLHVRLGDGTAAVEVLSRAEHVDDPELRTDALTTKALGLWQIGALDRALEIVDAVPTSRDGTSWEADLVAVRAMLRMYAGQLPQALVDFDAAVRIVHLWRPSTNQTRTYLLRSMVRYHLGDWDGAAVDAAAGRALAQEASHAWSAALAFAVSANVPTGRGLWDVATDYLTRATAALTNVASANIADTVRSFEVAFHVAREDHQAAFDVLAPIWSDEYLDRLSLARTYRPIMQARIRSFIGLDRLADAERDLARYEEMVTRFPQGPVPHRLGWLRGLLAEARADPWAAREHYADDLADPQTHEEPFVLAQLLHTSGRLERAIGNRREAIDLLTRARDIFAALRAAPFLERSSKELADCGLHSNIADPLALTQREQDVTALVMRGYTNKEAAAELFLTAKTVEYHLRNIYAKLGIRSRRELRQLR